MSRRTQRHAVGASENQGRPDCPGLGGGLRRDDCGCRFPKRADFRSGSARMLGCREVCHDHKAICSRGSLSGTRERRACARCARSSRTCAPGRVIVPSGGGIQKAARRPGRQSRCYSKTQKTQLFLRDGFLDRYSGEQLVSRGRCSCSRTCFRPNSPMIRIGRTTCAIAGTGRCIPRSITSTLEAMTLNPTGLRRR